MARSLADAGVPRIPIKKRRINYHGGAFDVVEVDEVTHRHAMGLMINTKQVLQDLGETSTPTFETVALSSLTPGDSVIVGPGGELTGSAGGGIVPSLSASGSTAAPAIALADLVWAATDHDNTAWLSTPSASITVDATGLYLVTFDGISTNSGSTSSEVVLLKNGGSTGVFVYGLPTAGSPATMTFSRALSLTSGDILKVQGTGIGGAETIGGTISVTKIGVLT